MWPFFDFKAKLEVFTKSLELDRTQTPNSFSLRKAGAEISAHFCVCVCSMDCFKLDSVESPPEIYSSGFSQGFEGSL